MLRVPADLACREDRFELVDVTVFRMDVTGQKKHWREEAERELRWVSPLQAAELVQEPGLQGLLRDFAADAGAAPLSP